MFPPSLIGASVVVAKGKTGPAGKSNTAHLYLYEKDSTSWEIVEDGAWGKMKYNQSGEELCLVFNGHGLETGARDVVVGVLLRERPARRLAVCAQARRTRILRVRPR